MIDKTTLLDIQLKSTWLNSLVLASSHILAGSSLVNQDGRETVALYLLDVMAFISSELEGNISERLENLYSVIEEQGAHHE